VLRAVAVLPSLATLGNLGCGLGAIYICMLSAQAGGADLVSQTAGNASLERLFPTFIAIAAYLLVVAMFFDAVDGRLARLTRKTSEFGGQLDSLADMVSFGVAPAVLVLCIVRPSELASLSSWARAYWRLEWVMAAIYVCCTALRLARFNVENEEDESAHMGFRGLPTPGAAAAIIGLVIFHQDLLPNLELERTGKIAAMLMPPFAMLLGLLMVSRFEYTHLVNSLLRERRPFHHLVAIAILFLFGLIVQFQLTIAIAAGAYAVSGPVTWIIHKIRRRGKPSADTTQSPTAPSADETDPQVDDDQIFDDDDGNNTIQSTV
jgi:CDP-diacylglycerol--serine O-phosphatidyltransferase